MSGLLSALTGGESDQANQDLEAALQQIQGVNTPTADSMTYKLQQLVQAGVLTPEQAQTYLQSPNAMLGMNIDQTGTKAQQDAIAQLEDAASAGGESPEMQAQQAELTQQMGAQEKGANDAALQDEAARGGLTSGEALAAELGNNENEAVNANETAETNAGNSYEQMLNELTSAGSLGSGLQGQENQQADTVAAATNAINNFNATQEQNEENLNVGNKNAAQEFNLQNEQNIGNQNVENENDYSRYEAQLPQQVYEDQLQKAAAEAGVSENQANQATEQGGQEAGLEGGLIGVAGTVGASAMAPTPTTNIIAASGGGEVPSDIHTYLDGGEVNADDDSEQPRVKGDSPKNDRVPAFLSSKEIVLPRSVSVPAMHGDDAKVTQFLNRIRSKNAPTKVHPEDTAHMLKALSLVRDAQ